MSIIFISSSLKAQVNGSGISGFVYDDADNILNGALISILHTGTGFTSSATTDRKGYFSFRDVPVGNYTSCEFCESSNHCDKR